MTGPDQRYNDLNGYFRGLFGCRVHKITVDAGLTCPNRDGTISRNGCIYCNASGSGSGAHLRGLSITQQLETGKNILSRKYKAKKFIAYFQSFSNTYAPLDTLKGFYDEALAVKDIAGLSIGTRPDCVDEPVLALLQGYARRCLVWLEYGLQSAHDSTLAFIQRGHDLQCFRNAVLRTQNRGIKICAHVILGLPRETRRQMLETAAVLSSMGLDGIKLHLLYVVKGTALETLFLSGGYVCLEQQEYVDLVCDFLERIPARIVIQRLTGDPHAGELTAPAWALKKTQTLALIKDQLRRRDTWQGKLCVRP
ncbi:MAG: TIGR01212 family radical SAM protein [Desulfobacterales bacterium]|nr:TIGR01212 family radical SAM protein [Desulfobacterales bacterium]